MLSGYTDLCSVTESVNRSAIYTFLTKPLHQQETCTAMRAPPFICTTPYDTVLSRVRSHFDIKPGRDAHL
jgi:hypothetical protein